MPPLMRAVDGAGPVGMLGIGFALAAFNPKDLLLAAAGGAEIGAADATNGGTILALGAFILLSASTAIIPVAAYAIVGKQLDGQLERSRQWLIRHNPTVMSIVLVLIGALFIWEGYRILGN